MEKRQVELAEHTSPDLVVRTMDFDTCDESLHAKFWRDAPKAVLGPCDVCFAINAPLNFAPTDTGAQVIFYLDPVPQNRQLDSLSYQIIHQAKCPKEQFRDWAELVMPYLREALIGGGLVGTDFADFRSVLGESGSRQLQCELIDYKHPWKVPEAQLQELRFRTLFASLFGSADLSLPMYLELDEALCRLNPDLTLHKLGLKVYPCEPPMLLLLGEPEG